MLEGKNILLGVSGGIAAYKIASLASALTKRGCAVQVMMTKAAEQFVAPVTFEALTHRRVFDDVFDRADPSVIHHIALAAEADAVEAAVDAVLAEGWRTPDIAGPGVTPIGTQKMGELICRHIG